MALPDSGPEDARPAAAEATHVGRLELIPNMEERYYGFWGTGTPQPVIAGVVPQSVPSPRRRDPFHVAGVALRRVA